MTQIRVELELIDGSFTTRMLRAGQTVANFNAELRRTNPTLALMANANASLIRSIDKADVQTKGFMGSLRDMSIVVGVVSLGISKIAGLQNSWVGEIVKINAHLERLNLQMQSMAMSSDPVKEAGDNIRYLQNAATRMPFTMQTITDGFVKLKSTGIDPMSGSLQNIADGVAAFGGTQEAFSRTILAITQMSGKGVIQMEELRQQLGESMPRAVELMARSMGVSMAQLIKAISTGTVAAGPALRALYAELERTYGGRAQLMMQTFDGQVSQAATNLQLLAQKVGGMNGDMSYAEGGFFAVMRNQLMDLNEFLGSRSAGKFAEELGSILANVVTRVREGVDWIIRMRGAIFEAAKVLAIGFGASAIGSTIGAATKAVGSLVTASRLLMMQWQAMRAQQLFVGPLQAGAVAAGTLTMSLRGVAAAATATAVAIGTVAPWVALLAGGVMIAADAFGWFQDKGADAVQTLRDFTAATREQLDQAKSAAAAKAADLQRAADMDEQFLERAKKRYAEMAKSGEKYRPVWLPSPEKLAELEAEIERKRQEARQIAEDSVAAEEEFTDRQDQKQLVKLQKNIDKTIRALQTGYDLEQRTVQARWDGIAKEADKRHLTATQVNEGREKDLLAAQVKFIEAKANLFEGEIKANEAKLKVTQGVERAQLETQHAWLIQQANDLRRDLEQARGADLGIEMLTPLKSNTKIYDDAVKKLEQLSGTVGGLKADLAGANETVIELNQVIASGQYGDVEFGAEKFRQLRDEISKAIAEKKALDALVKGKQDLESDIAKERKRIAEETFVAQRKALGLETTELDKIMFRLQAGDYAGYGPQNKIYAAIKNVVSAFDVQGAAQTAVGASLRDDTFGDRSRGAIDATRASIVTMKDAVDALGVSLGNISFDKFGQLTSSGIFEPVMTGLTEEMSQAMADAMQMFMAKGWSRTAAAGIVGNLMGESGLDPTRVGDDGTSYGIAQFHDTAPGVGRWTNLKNYAAANKLDWTKLKTQIDFIDHELRTSEAEAGGLLALAGSAQQASDTFMRRYERPSMSAMAQSGGSRAGFAVQAYDLVTPNSESATYRAHAQELDAAIEAQTKATEEKTQELKTLAGKQAELDQLEADNALAQARKDLAKAIEDEKAGITSSAGGSEEQIKAIRNGLYGTSTTAKDPANERYKELLALARDLDAVQAKTAERKSAQSSAETTLINLEEQRVSLIREAAEAQARMNNPLLVETTSAYRTLEDNLNKYINDVERAYGRDTENYRNALRLKGELLGQQRVIDYATTATGYAEEARQLREGLLTEREQRRAALAQRLAEIDAQIAAIDQSEQAGVEAVRRAEELKAALRAQYADQNDPMTRKMKEWTDLSTALEQASLQWVDNIAGGVTNLIMGTGTLKEAVQGIARDLVQMGVRSFIGSMMLGQGGTAKLGKSVGVAHTGGIIGSSRLLGRPANLGMFINAPKFHTGGVVGKKLLPDEVPIIAKKGEGVFTPEQMSAMGGVQSNTAFTIHAPVTVHGSAGTPAQNADLARQVAKEFENTARAIFAEELRNAQRPGNALNTRSR